MRVVLAVTMVALLACGGGSDKTVEGRLAAVEGDLTSIQSFVLLTEAGERWEFSVASTATFHGGPLSHVRDHLLSGESIRVSYVERSGQRVATGVDDR